MFRKAVAADRQTLDDMTLAGLRHWGHDVNHPEAFAGLVAALGDAPSPEENPVYVLEEDGRVAGFFELRDRGEHIELLRMFLATDLIGNGYGRILWDEAVEVAFSNHDRMLIMSDPSARGFYQAMGAELESRVEVTPGFSLWKFWYEPDGA